MLHILLEFLEHPLKSPLHGSGSSRTMFFPIIAPAKMAKSGIVLTRGPTFRTNTSMPLTLGCIRKFPRNFLMHSLFSCIWRICELPILDLSSQGGCIRKFPGNFLMHPRSSEPGSIGEFPGNFLMRPRKKFKLQPASQRSQQASQPASQRSQPASQQKKV